MGADNQLVKFIQDEIDYIEYTPGYLLENENLEITELELTEPQTEFLFLEKKYPCFVAGFGAGKSTMMAVSVLRDLRFPHNKPIKIGCYCPTYDLLKLITIPYLAEFLEVSGIGYKLNKQDYIFYLDTGDQIIMRSMDNPARIVGYETFRAHVDELDTLNEEKAKDAWNKIIGRNRQPVYKYDDNGGFLYYTDKKGKLKKQIQKNKVSAYTTPEGFGFVYKTWGNKPKESYGIITAPTYSNPNLDDDYIDGLRESYPGELIEAYIEGRFVNLKSGTIYSEFDRKLNGTLEKINKGDELHIGMDFNVNNMSAVVCVKKSNKPYALYEFSKGKDTHDVCKRINAKYHGHRITIYPDASGDNKSSKNASESDITIIKSYGFRIKMDRKNPFVKDRVLAVCAQICNGKGERSLMINEELCPDLAESLEKQIWGKDGKPDKTAGYDHFPDSLGYFIFQLWPVKRNKKGVRKNNLFAA